MVQKWLAFVVTAYMLLSSGPAYTVNWSAFPKFPDAIRHEHVHSIKEIDPNVIESWSAAMRDVLPRVASGIETLGDATAKAMGPVGVQILKITLGTAVITLTGYAAQALIGKYVTRYFFEPALIEKQSQRSWMPWGTSSAQPVLLREHMVVHGDHAQDLEFVIRSAQQVKECGGAYEHVLLYGPPGTGKTLFAQLVAQHCGMDYALIPAANVSQFLTQGTVVQELSALFAWAERSARGTILFFDEADVFLAHRASLSSMAQNALAFFLAKTGMPSHKIMIICATNRPDALDAAVVNRLGMQIHFALPDESARYAQLVMHRDKEFTPQSGVTVSCECLYDHEVLAAMAQATEGCSGRTLQKIMNRLRQSALLQGDGVVTRSLIDRVIAQYVHNNGAWNG